MIIGILLFTVCMIVLLKGRNEEKQTLKDAGKALKVPRLFGSAGLFAHRIARSVTARIFRKEKREDDENPLLLSDSDKIVQKANHYGAVCLVVLIGSAAAAVLGLASLGDRTVTEIRRPEFGTEKQIRLIAEQDGSEEEVSVIVTGQLISEDQIEPFLDAVFEREKKKWLGDNPSESEVRKRLQLTEESAEGVCFSFQSEDPELLSKRGSILADELTETGSDATLLVTLSFRNTEKTYRWTLRLLPEEVADEHQDLQSAIEEANANGLTDETMTLPTNAGGHRVVFLRRVTSPYPVIALTALVGGLLMYLPKERKKAALKKRQESFSDDYAGLVQKLSMLIGAGLSIRMAWARTVSEYRKALANGLVGKTYAYEEMARTLNELQSGASEAKAYADFGIRCGHMRYRKLGNLLSENMRQGISGLEEKLREETESAMEERKNTALRRGEEAGTKLLMPMMILLGIVLVTLVVPAFMAL